MSEQGWGLPLGASQDLAIFCPKWTFCRQDALCGLVGLLCASLSGSGLINRLVHRKPQSWLALALQGVRGSATRSPAVSALLSVFLPWSLPPSPSPFQKLLWASCHAGDTPMINFDFHQFAKGGKLEKLENLLRPQLKLHWDDFDVFTEGENVSPR